jgi:hypothetical protein
LAVAALALAACARGSDPPQLAQGDAPELAGTVAPNPPDMALLGPAITEAFKNAKFTGYPRVSSARPAPVSALGDWIVCLTSDAESERRIYALFIRDNAIVDGRLAVVIDDCTEETFAPLPGR